MNSVGSPMRKPQLTSASSREAHAPGTRIVTLLPLPPPVGKGSKLAPALHRYRHAAVAPPVGEVVGAAVAEDLGGQLLSGAGIARQLLVPRIEPGPRLESRHSRGVPIQAVDRPARRHP